jgi:hypothetical protein
MFGLLAGCQSILSGEARKTWRWHVCGLCEGLSRAFCPPARLLMTPDAALLSLLVEAQAPSPPLTWSPSRCLIRRPFHLRVTMTDSPGARFARSVAVAAAVARLEDAVRDGDPGPRWMSRAVLRALRPLARRAEDEMTQLGFDPGLLGQAQERAVRAEATSRDFDALCGPTEQAYAALVAHTGVLAGHDDNAFLLCDLGRWFGRLTHVTDARIDLTADLRHGRFNPLVACFGTGARSRGGDIANVALEHMRETLRQLHLSRHREVISQLLCGGVGRKVAWACGRSEGGRRVGTGRREPAPDGATLTPQGKRPRWRGWGCSGALSEPEQERTATWCLGCNCCAEPCCLAPLCCCCS